MLKSLGFWQGVIQPKTRTAEGHNQNDVKSAAEPKKATSESKGKKRYTL